MARKGSPTISQEELYPSLDEDVRPDFDDARMLDLDAEESSPFLRAQRRVSARRGPLAKKTANRLKWAVVALAILGMAAFAAGSVYRYGKHSWRFRINSSDDIEISGNHHVTHAQVMDVLGGDIGRNIFFVPLAQRKVQLEQIPWVESASVMRFVPNRIKVEIQERTPVAFARVGSRISLVDAGGTLMDLPATNKQKYSFPVILGTNAGEPLSTRSARMKIYNELVRELDSGGAHYSQDLSEVDLSDPEDVKVVANDPRGAVLVHLGSSNFLDRYKIYVGHVQEWRQQFDKLESVDLRYDRQIIVNPDLRGTVKQGPLSASAARVAAAAGVKPAALVVHEATPVRPKIGPLPPPKPAKQVSRKPSRWQKAKHSARKPPVKTAPTTTAKATPPAITPSPKSTAPPAATPDSSHLKTPALPEQKTTTDIPKPGQKPSPAIPKDQGHR